MAWTRMLPSGKYQGIYRDRRNEERSAGTFTQRAEALRKAAKLEEEQRGPLALDVKGGKITWGAWFEQWIDARVLAYSTEDCYRSTAGNHVMPQWENVKLEDITTLDVSKWVRKMLRPPKRSKVKPKSPWVVRNALMLFKTSLNAAVDDKRLALNPAKKVEYPDLPDGLERYLTPDEAEAIAFYMDGLNSLILWVGVQTGLRFGEVAGLHWKRLDLKRGVIRVVEKFDQKEGVMNPSPKDKEDRTVPLPPDLVGQLRRYAEHAAPGRQMSCGIRHTAGRCDSDLVFRGPRGAVLRSNEWGRGPWKRALDLAGIEDRVRPHDMRHTYASWLIQEGVPLPEIARVMGHSDEEVTRRYAHLSDAGFDTVRDALTRHRGLVVAEPEPDPVPLGLEERLAALEAQVAALSGRTAAHTASSPKTALSDASSTSVEQAS
ncbi:tyrosine-type recombinase/integrase [Prauserella flavalba]|uniref:tyrosine-type recombinase/integrase n=1 Tax=Prauserella flavalba TaxID=1477506 RepID=UPI0036E08C20